MNKFTHTRINMYACIYIHSYIVLVLYTESISNLNLIGLVSTENSERDVEN